MKNVTLKDQDIVVSLINKSEPTFKLENEKIQATFEKQDVNFYLKKHPEIQVFFESLFVSGGNVQIITQEEYDKSNKNRKTIYLIVENDDLVKFYIGTFLIAQKDENGFFPYNFPIIF